MNETELKWLGYSRDEVVGKMGPADLHTPASLENFKQRFEAFRKTGIAKDVEYEFRRKDGSVLPVVLNATAVRDRDGNFLMSRSTIFDNTERKRVALALRDSEKEMRMLQETTLAISEAEGSKEAFAVLLRKVCEYFGWSFAQAWLPDEGQNRLLLGAAWYSSIAELGAFRKANESLGFAPRAGVLEQVWRSKRAGWDWDLKPLPAAVRRPLMLEAGLKSWIGVPVLADGDVIAVIEFFDYEYRQRDEGVLRLISILTTQLGPVIQRKRATEQIDALNASLKVHAAELEAANRELEAFSYSVSHDLRAPLRAVDGYALMLSEDYAKRLDDEGRRLLGVVREEARRMGLLIDDLLRFSQIGRKPLALAPVDMRALAAEAVGELSAAYPKVRVDLRDLPVATGDRALLKHVWMNLVGNALKYSAQKDSPRVEISGRASGSENIYTVRDNGAGFDMRYYEKLFKVFQRLHREDEFEGTGVGLAIVQRVVARHGGRVWGEGTPGEGASFHFALPVEG
jgi:PAS domain S-box-containing protein